MQFTVQMPYQGDKILPTIGFSDSGDIIDG